MSSVSWASSSRVSYTRRGVPGGLPVVFFHGWPSSFREQFAGEDLLAQLELDWFSLNRPGYGATAWESHHGLLDWPTRVAAWADEMQLERFHVVGFSGGGPFAQACAYALPDRVLSLTLLASLAPQGLPLNVVTRFLLRRTPQVLATGLQTLNAYRRRFPERCARRSLQALHPHDQALLAARDFLPTLREVQADAFAQGTRHLLRDLQLYDGPWGFDPAHITVPTRVFVGSEDVQVPAACSHWLAQRIPGAHLTVYPGEAHYIPFTHAHEILSAIVIP